ncbi:anti-sigma factor [Paraburkholderia sp. J41]|uniref:anti-sigma factor n=1 Tax=Paraburkholderia sp. J41 TaxID=2805433 RepID=UPI002AC35E1C|nr:anti-sigma factor [Paraburkholderia sp. J41]
MKVDETLLMAYVDGELPQAQRAEVEAFVAGDAQAAELVRLLRASQHDYREAFEAETLPPLPASLAASVDDLVRAHRSAANAPQMPPTSQAAQTPQAAARAPLRSRWRTVPSWLAAACVAGAFCAGLMLHVEPFNGNAPTAASGMAPWVAAAVGYQALYTRDSVSYSQGDIEHAPGVVKDIRAEDHLDLQVPDLSQAGLEFKRIQRLNFNHKPLVQIVYLPRKGPPIALCVIREPKPDAGPQGRSVDSMRVITWRQAQVGYALIGKPEGVDLDALGKQIAARATGQLFGAATNLPPET